MKIKIVSLILYLFLINCKQSKPSLIQPNILLILADDWSYPYAGFYGNKQIHTPNMDSIASRGTVFTHAFCAVPSCTPSRAAILTGKYPHRLGEGVNLVGKLDYSITTYVKDFRKAGYKVAFERKGWAPGDYLKMGYKENPCGDSLSLDNVLKDLKPDQPFFYWWGTHDPHRNFDYGSGAASGKNIDSIHVPGYLPNVAETRNDIADYMTEIERMDKEIGQLLNKLEIGNKLRNTIVVITSDNGMPFPHAKANLYDHGTRIPLIITDFRNENTQVLTSDAFVNLIDLTATFYDMAAIKNIPEMDGISLLPLLTNSAQKHRAEVYLERERHCMCRAEMNAFAGYPMRAVRTKDYLYIRNFRPHRFPGGDETIPGTPSVFGDIDGGPTKIYMMDHRGEKHVTNLFNLAFGLRPAEELYHVHNDPFQLNNLVADSSLTEVKQDLSKKLTTWMKDTKDPRTDPTSNLIDHYVPTTRAWITRDGIVLLDGK